MIIIVRHQISQQRVSKNLLGISKAFFVFISLFFPAAIVSSFCCFIFHIFVGGMCVVRVSQIIYVLLCTVRCSCVPPFIPLYPLLHHPPFSLMGRVALTLFHLRIPHSVNPSSFTPWLQDSLLYLFLLLSLSRTLTHSPHLLSLSLSNYPSPSLDTVSFLLKRIARLHKWFHVKPTPSQPPLIPFRLWHRFTVTD